MSKSVNDLHELLDKLYGLKARAVVNNQAAARRKLKQQIVDGANVLFSSTNHYLPEIPSASGGQVAEEKLAELKQIQRKAEELREWALHNL